MHVLHEDHRDLGSNQGKKFDLGIEKLLHINPILGWGVYNNTPYGNAWNFKTIDFF